jgi:hypothetical protein
MPSGGVGVSIAYRLRISRHLAGVASISGNPLSYGANTIQAGAGVSFSW